MVRFFSEQHLKKEKNKKKKEEPLKKKGCLFQEPLVSRIQRKAVRKEMVSKKRKEKKGLFQEQAETQTDNCFFSSARLRT